MKDTSFNPPQEAVEFMRLLLSTVDNSTDNTSAPTGAPIYDSMSNEGRDPYEFVAFLLWYLFLVVCCVLPTCCAYRRRRLVEARITQQQANFDQLHQRNIFILSSLHLRPDLEGEEAKAERTRRIIEELKATTFTVAESDIAGNFETPRELGREKTKGGPKPSICADEEFGCCVVDSEAMNHASLSLPVDAPHASRSVPGSCAICLCPYDKGDEVTWSKEESCQHAFHRECIVPWLAKKNESKCPCCRQDFCTVESVTSTDLSILTPLGLIPASLATSTGGSPFFVGHEGMLSTREVRQGHMESVSSQ